MSKEELDSEDNSPSQGEEAAADQAKQRDGNPPLTPPEIPSEDDLQRWEDLHWAIDNLELRDQYPGQYVAVHKKTILAVGPDSLVVRAEAQAKSALAWEKIVVAAIDDPLAWLGE